MTDWSRISNRRVFSCPYFTLEHDRYRLPSGKESDYFYVHTLGSTMVVPRLACGTLVLTRQFRYLMGHTSIEFPAGGLKAGLTPLDNARQELEEEAGYRAASWTLIGKFSPYKGVARETCHVFLAEELEPCPPCPEETEDIEVLRATTGELRAMIGKGEVTDGMSLAAFALFERWEG
jgi:ADP-ribose pyrophosphatase